jgi:hypothetical protein
MAPVAALIVVRPCIEVNAIEGDSLDADAESEDAGAHFAVEAVLVHAEVGRGFAQPDEARWRHDRSGVYVWFSKIQGRVVTRGQSFHALARLSGLGFAENYGETWT